MKKTLLETLMSEKDVEIISYDHLTKVSFYEDEFHVFKSKNRNTNYTSVFSSDDLEEALVYFSNINL